MRMPVRYLSDPELARLSGGPDEIADEDAVTYFTCPRTTWHGWRASTAPRTGSASPFKLSTLPWLGWIPDELAACARLMGELEKRDWAVTAETFEGARQVS
ncbi:MAG: hypothetical protein ACR2JG_14960 [Geodermatophilaceae bacterium]